MFHPLSYPLIPALSFAIVSDCLHSPRSSRSLRGLASILRIPEHTPIGKGEGEEGGTYLFPTFPFFFPQLTPHPILYILVSLSEAVVSPQSSVNPLISFFASLLSGPPDLSQFLSKFLFVWLIFCLKMHLTFPSFASQFTPCPDLSNHACIMVGSS